MACIFWKINTERGSKLCAQTFSSLVCLCIFHTLNHHSFDISLPLRHVHSFPMCPRFFQTDRKATGIYSLDWCGRFSSKQRDSPWGVKRFNSHASAETHTHDSSPRWVVLLIMAQIEFAGHLIKVIWYEIFAELNFMCVGVQLLTYSNGQCPRFS